MRTRDVSLENSYDGMTLESTVLDWFTVSNTEAYYANGKSGLPWGGGLIRDAMVETLVNADTTIDFTDFDQDGNQQC